MGLGDGEVVILSSNFIAENCVSQILCLLRVLSGFLAAGAAWVWLGGRRTAGEKDWQWLDGRKWGYQNGGISYKFGGNCLYQNKDGKWYSSVCAQVLILAEN